MHKKAALFLSEFLFHFTFISSFFKLYFFFTVFFFLYPKMLELLFFGLRTQLKWCSEKNGLTQIVFLWEMSHLHRQCLRVSVSHTRTQRLSRPWDASSWGESCPENPTQTKPDLPRMIRETTTRNPPGAFSKVLGCGTDRVKWSTSVPTSSPTRSWLGHSSPRCRHSRMSSWQDVCSATNWSTPLVTLSPVNYRERETKS